MPSPTYLMCALVVMALIAMARGVAPELALSAVLCVALAVGIIDTSAALAGFSSESLHTIGLLLIVSAAVQRAGGLRLLRSHLFAGARSLIAAQIRIVIPTAVSSAFLNNTAVVALLVPLIRESGGRLKFPPSRLLIPLSYASILGGMCTLIGTSTNLIVQGLLPEHLVPEFGMFDVSQVGVPAALAGMLVIFATSHKLLPDRSTSSGLFADPREFTTELRVEPEGPLVGRTLEEVGMHAGMLVNPVEVWRRGVVLAAPRRNLVLQADDHLVLAGPASEALAVHRIPGLTPTTDMVYGASAEGGRRFHEMIIGPRCPLVGHRVGDGSFRARYSVAIVAVARHGQSVRSGSMRGWALEVGDIVLVESQGRLDRALERDGELIIVAGHDDDELPNTKLAPLALLILAGMVIAAASGHVSSFLAVLGAAAACIGLRLLRWSQALEAIDLRLLLTIAAALGVGRALQSSGAAMELAGVLAELGGGSPWLTLAIIYIVTSIITEFVTNNAAAVIMVPFAIASAATLGVNPMAMIMAVAIAASASFITPIGYQTNLMVYGPGGYRFSDFMRAGLPVTITVAATTIGLAPMIWPF